MKRVSNDFEEGEDSPKAYNALLTLLGSAHPSKKQKSSQKYSEIRKDNAVETGDNVEGLVEVESDEEGSLSEVETREEDLDNQEEEIEAIEDNEGDLTDPFESHFAASDLADIPNPESWKSAKYPLSVLGDRSLIQLPQPSNRFQDGKALKKVESLQSLKLKHRLLAPFESLNPKLDQLQQEFLGPVYSYQDVLYSRRSWDNAQSLQNIYTLHALNHIFKTRDRVLKNSQRLAQSPGEEFQDQGFARPKVLVLVPTRNSAVQFVETLIKLAGAKQVQNKKRFMDAFKTDSEPVSNKPEDFQHQFAGNTNDLFCLGMKLTRQTAKLYTSFYTSDIIIGSPLGLRMIIGNEGDKKRDWDFLSSIEVLIADQLDAMYMQSWDNVDHVFSHLNLMPKEAHGCDFSRIRPWYLEHKAPLLRQTIMISEFATPEMYNLLSRRCKNIAGKVKTRSAYYGIMADLGLRIRQVFKRLPSPNHSQDTQERFDHFIKATLPGILRGASHNGTLVFIPSYLDFVRVRNYMEKHNVSFVTLSEYTPTSQVSRGRSYFNDGRAAMMLYTQRLHHFRRFSLKGVHTVVFYGLPDNPLFYREIVRFLARTVVEQKVDPDMLKVVAAYSKWDMLKLERIVGSSRVGQLMEGSNDTFEFY